MMYNIITLHSNYLKKASVLQLTYPRRWTLAGRNQPHDFGRLDYSTESHVFVVEQGSTVKEMDRLYRQVFFCELVHRGLCTGSRLARTSCTVP